MGISPIGALIIGSVVAVALAAFKVIENLVTKNKPLDIRFPSDVKKAVFDTGRMTKALLMQHAPEQGVERWKWPQELSEIIRTMAETQRSQTKLMEMWGANLRGHQEKEEHVLQEIRDTLKDVAGVLKLRRAADM